MDEQQNEQWAVVELMGHAKTAGRISRPADMGGLLRVDVPMGDSYRTEFYGMAAIYAVKLVSKEIAQAYGTEGREVIEYNVPIVTREQYQAMREDFERRLRNYKTQVYELERRLTAINAPADAPGLPEPEPDYEEHDEEA